MVSILQPSFIFRHTPLEPENEGVLPAPAVVIQSPTDSLSCRRHYSTEQAKEKLFLTNSIVVVIPSLMLLRLWYLNCKMLTLWHQEAKALSLVFVLQRTQRSQPRFMSLSDTSGWHWLNFQMLVKFQAMNIDGDQIY